MPVRPENEDKEKEENEEHGDVVHGAQHHDQLVAQGRHETHELQYPQKSECTQYGQTAGAALYQLHQATYMIQHRPTVPYTRRHTPACTSFTHQQTPIATIICLWL